MHNIQIQPLQRTTNHDIHTINKDDLSIQSQDIDFIQRNGYYSSLDPRTYDVPRSQRLEFHQPPRVSINTQPQGDLYTHNRNNTGFYPDYESIKGGDLTYYTDITNDTPFSNPPFQIPSYTFPELLIDPMGSVKPYYKRVPILEKNNNLYEYSFDQDQCEFREDLMALQLSKISRSNFGYFQFFNDQERYFPDYHPTKNNFPWTKK